MAAGGRVILRRGHGGSRRRKVADDDDEEDEDEEYVVDEDEEEVQEEEEEEEYVAAACSDEEEAEPEDESDADFDGDEEELEDLEEEEIETPRRPKRPPKAAARGRKGKPAGSRRRRHEDDDDDDYQEEIEEEDEDFDPDVDEEEEDDDYQEEIEEEDEDFDPDVDEEEEEDDEEMGDFPPIRAKKVRPRNHVAKRKPAAGRQQLKKKRNGSKVSKGKSRKGTSASARRRRKRWVDDNYEDEEEEEEDEDFVVKDDQDEVNHRPRKKAKVGRKARDGTPEPAVGAETWPSVESDTSDFEFVTSDEEPANKEAPIAEPARIKGRKSRRKWGSGSESSSDSDYVISEEELKDLEVPRTPETTLLQPPAAPPRRTILLRRVEEKGKEPEEAFKQICGICLSEEQRATIQGVLNCCSHYFCFACILEWSKVESRCPLCKRRFNTITKSSMADLVLGSRKAVIRVEKRDQVYQPTEEEMRRWLDPYENVVCIECNQGGDDNLMLLCDICDSSAHTYCVGLGREVPEGNWYCGGCRSGGEGPSYAQTQDKVVHHGESYANPADTCSGSFSTAISSGVFQRPPPINIQPSPQEFDLNLSPRETPEEAKLAGSHISADPISTPTGRHATLGRRRALSRRIRILLFRPRITDNEWQSGVQRDRTGLSTEQSQQSTCTSTEMNPSFSRADFMQSQQSSSPFVQSANNLTRCTDEDGSNFRQIEGAKGQLIPIVKKCLKRICAQSPLDQSAFKNVARRATHTILALSGIAHNQDMVVTTPYTYPSGCYHACDGREPAFLMETCCSSCFNSFVGDVVSHIANMLS